MLKIHCPDCLKDFMWTDQMPLKGKCPTPDCTWQYDVKQALKHGISQRTTPSSPAILCPNCGAEIRSRFSLCRGCGHFVTGPTTWGKGFLIFSLIILILVISIAWYKHAQ